MQIQLVDTLKFYTPVVICFKFSNFAYANTVYGGFDVENSMLLFALNLVTLLMQIQCECFCERIDDSCYLL